VKRWWNHEFTPEAVERDFGGSVDQLEPSEDYLALLDGQPIGLIQCCRYGDYPEYLDEMATVHAVSPDSVSIDYFIGAADQCGRGLGRAMLAAFVSDVWSRYPDAPNVVVPTSAANIASWKALAHAGFVKVAEGPLEPDNPIDDPWHVVMSCDRPHPFAP
jgi:aminoglycoside 6'-N-acetyltransferase